MTHCTLLLSLVLLQAPTPINVAVEPLSGPTLTGSLVQLSDQAVVIQVDGQPRTIKPQDLVAIVPDQPSTPDTEGATVWIEYVDGSKIVGVQYTVQDQTASIQIGDRRIETATSHIRSVRFHAPSETLDPQWKEILQAQSAGDVLVLRRSDTSLDQLEGLFFDVSAEQVQFEFNGDRIPVNRNKLEGIVYFHPTSSELPKIRCVVQDADGCSWHAQSVTLQDQSLLLVTTGSSRLNLPWNEVTRLDFSSGNLAYLSDLDFDIVECTPFVGSNISPNRLRQFYGPRRDVNFRGEQLQLGDGENFQEFTKGLSIHSRSQIVFRLAGQFKRFSAIAGIDRELRGWGDLELVIAGDERELLRKEIRGTDPPLPIDLDVAGVQRLKILVDFGSTSDVADQLNLCNARIIK